MSVPAPRPLWRKIWEFPLIVMVVAMALVAASMMIVIAPTMVIEPEQLNPYVRLVLFPLIAVALVFLVTKFAISRLGRSLRDDLPLATAPRDLAMGFGVGFFTFSGCVAIAAVLGVYSITGWGEPELLDTLNRIAVTGFLAGFVEEVLFRGILFRWVEELAGSWIALAISSALFGFAHYGNDNATVFSSVAIAIEAGILLGAAYMLTRSLWLAVGIHASWNLTQGLIYDVNVSGNEVDGIVSAQMSGPDWLSGGAFGLEASVIALVIVTLVGIWMLRLAAQRGHFVRPMWVKDKTP